MVDVPTIVYISGRMGHGGIKPRTEYLVDGTYGSQETRDALAHRVVPDDPTTGAPSAATLGWYPVFDGKAGDTIFIVASATTTTVTVTPDPGWTTDEWDGFTLRNNNLLPTALGLANRDIEVLSNTTDTLTVAAWDPDLVADPNGTIPATPDVGSGVWLSEGRYRDTHIVGAWRTITEVLAGAVPTRSGASWQLNNFGISPVPMLVRELWENVWTSSPYFQIDHYFTDTAIVGGFDDGTGSERAAFLAEKVRWDAAWTELATGNDKSVDYVILDLSQNDVLDWAVTAGNALLYYDDLVEMIAWLRSAAVFDDSTLKILIVSHDVAINNVTTPSGTATANTIHGLVAVADANVYVENFNGRGWPLRADDAATPTWVPTTNADSYSCAVFLRDYPKALRERIALLEEGAAPSAAGVIPVYTIEGDSITVGQGLTSTYTDALDDPVLTGSARDSRQKIWSRAAGAVEVYDAHANSNTSGTVSAAAGFEFSLLDALMRRHPDTGVVVVKRASGGSTLIADHTTYSAGGGGRWSKTYAATEHYDERTADIEDALQYVNSVLGKQGEVMAHVVGLGTNDQAVAGGGTLFAAEIESHCANIRSDYGTHTTGRDTPILWVKPQLGASTAIAAESILVRDAIEARARSDRQFRVVDVDHLARGSDNLHLTPDATVDAGYLIDEQLDLVALPNCS